MAEFQNHCFVSLYYDRYFCWLQFLIMFCCEMLFPPQVKTEQELFCKKRKTEWQAGLCKLPGDATLVKDLGLRFIVKL